MIFRRSLMRSGADEVLTVNADVPHVATRAIAVAPRVRLLESLVRERLLCEPTGLILKLETYRQSH